MAKCPNCGRKLHFKDWRPECPGCGVNLNYYQSNEKLLDESEKVEIEHAKFQPRVDRAKAATIGTKKGIIRLILFIIPALSLFIPVFGITVYGHKTNFNILGIYNVFSKIDIGKVLNNISPIVVSVVCMAIPVVLGLVFAILQITSGTKKGLTRNIVYSSISAFLILCSIVSLLIFMSKPAKSYVDLTLNEAEVLVKGGKQADVDNISQVIRDILSDDSGTDVNILLRAVRNGEEALNTTKERGYSDEEIAALKDAVDKGIAVLNKEDATTEEVREAALAINGAVDTYKDLETAVKFASIIQNDGIYSEKSFESLTNAVENGQEILDKLAKGEPVVDTETHNGLGKKSQEEIELETKEKVAGAIRDIDDANSSLVDISALTPLLERLNKAVEDGTAEPAIKVSIGYGGLLVYLALLIAQLTYNIIMKKKGFEVKYTTCLIGGLPSDEYFKLVDEGISKEDLNRKMLVALAKLEAEAIKAEEAEGKEDE